MLKVNSKLILLGNNRFRKWYYLELGQIIK